MGLFGNIFKPLQGKLTAKQEENMKKVAEVFKEKTGKDYQTAVVWKMTTKKKLTKTVHTYYNWLMGYGIDDNNIPEIVFPQILNGIGLMNLFIAKRLIPK